MSKTLSSYLSGRWQQGTGRTTSLYNPSTEEIVAQTGTEGLDLGAAVKFARDVGGPALRKLTFARRGELLAKLAQQLIDAREELIGLGILNAGNTRSDAKFDIDGAAVTLNHYAELGRQLGEVRVLPDGEGIALARSARLYGQHVLMPRHGVAVHINAFNFPAWGMGEKLAVSLLAGMPTISKPATATALMAHRIAELWVASGVLPDGAFSFLCGSAGDLLEHLRGQDVVAFTGSGDTAATLRRNENLARYNVRLNVEADSLNAAILGPDVVDGSETLNMFLGDVSKEITQKTGQKCTATRRIYVPRARLEEMRERLTERLTGIRVGNPSDEKVQMGPVATASQLRDVRAGIGKLAQHAKIVLGGEQRVDGLGAPAGKGYFLGPTLLLNEKPSPDDATHTLEVFGPVSTLMPYDDVAHLGVLIAAGGGGLVSAIYSDDKAFLEEAVYAIAPHHGRVTISSEKVAGKTVPPGTVMPHLLHGGPGRAGSGEELGGMRGMALYLQRTALQGDRSLVEHLAGVKKPAAPAA